MTGSVILSCGLNIAYRVQPIRNTYVHHHHHYHHHHHHVPEGLGVFPVPWSSRWSWSLHLFLDRPMFLPPFGLYRSACFVSLFVSILCTCRGYFFWYSSISFTTFCAPVFCLIHWSFSLSSFVIPSKCLKNFIYAASKRYSSLFFENIDLYLKKGSKLYFRINIFIVLLACTLLIWFC